MACNFNSVLKGKNACKENPAGVSNFCMIVPFADAVNLDSEDGFIKTVAIDESHNMYTITPEGSGTTLKGYRVDFKNQTGQVTSEDNGSGKGNTVTGTGRVEIGIDDMALLSRTLSNLDGNFLCFFPTGVKKVAPGSASSTPVTEWLVIGNPQGDITWTRTTDTGAQRSDDHGTTFQVSCDFQVYDTVKYYGEISQADIEAGSSSSGSSN